MKLEVELEFCDVYGGDGETRMIEVEETKLRRTKRRVETRKDIGVPVSDREIEEEQSEVREKDVQTFRRDEQGRPLLRIGGTHGKLWGTFKDVASLLKMMGESPFTSGYLRILSCLIVGPIWVPLELNGSSVQTVAMPQILHGARNSMIVQRFDVIPKCSAKVVLSFPDAMEGAVRKLLKGLEDVSMFNKRRTTAKVIKVTSC